MLFGSGRTEVTRDVDTLLVRLHTEQPGQRVAWSSGPVAQETAMPWSLPPSEGVPMMVCVPTALAGTSRCTFQSARDPRDQTLCPNPSSNSSHASDAGSVPLLESSVNTRMTHKILFIGRIGKKGAVYAACSRNSRDVWCCHVPRLLQTDGLPLYSLAQSRRLPCVRQHPAHDVVPSSSLERLPADASDH